MAEINTNSHDSGRKRKGQPNRKILRVDFTPMVDMMMLLITFFMFCTTLSTPQIMDVVMPTKKTDDGNHAPESRTTTLILSENDKIYYYFGKPDYEDSSKFMVTDYTANGLRNVLLNKNIDMVEKIRELKTRRARNEITKDEFKNELEFLKKSDNAQIVIIKPTNESIYNNLVNTLDEMQICGIQKYAVVEMEEADRYLLANFTANSGDAEAR